MRMDGVCGALKVGQTAMVSLYLEEGNGKRIGGMQLCIRVLTKLLEIVKNRMHRRKTLNGVSDNG
jgi:hypothetical protein